MTKPIKSLLKKTITQVTSDAGWVTLHLATGTGRKAGAITMPTDQLRDEDGKPFEADHALR